MTTADSHDRHNKNIYIFSKASSQGKTSIQGTLALLPRVSPEYRFHCGRIYYNTVSIRSNFINLRGNIEERKRETHK